MERVRRGPRPDYDEVDGLREKSREEITPVAVIV